MNIVLCMPSRGRPEQLVRCLQQWHKRAAFGPDQKMHVSIGLDMDDPCLDEYNARLADMGLKVYVDGQKGLPNTKVRAINETVANAHLLDPNWEVAIVAADDMIPVVDRWDEAIRDQVNKGGLDKMYWFDDGRQNVRCTLPVITRGWHEKYGHVYHPSYKAYYCDDEQTQASMERGELVRILGPMFLHNHCVFGAAPDDATYQRNRKYKAEDRRTFQIRKQHAWPQETPK